MIAGGLAMRDIPPEKICKMSILVADLVLTEEADTA